MTKSSVHAVRRRRTNQRIARQYDRIEQDRVRAYQQRGIERQLAIEDRAILSMFRRSINFVRKLARKIRRYFRSDLSSVLSLDLRDRGLYGEKPKRDAGAQQLRTWWHGLGNIVSTRDGKKV